MLGWILLLIILLPLLEIWIFIEIGGLIGSLSTIAAVLLTSVFGAFLARREGMQTYQLAQIQVRNGEMPGEALLDGFCILVGAILLLIPGFLTDLIGLCFLVPYSRAVIKVWMKQWLQKKLDSGNVSFSGFIQEGESRKANSRLCG